MIRTPILFTSDTSREGQVLTEMYRRTEEILIKLCYFEDVEATVTLFDGKMMNKKFFDALKERNPRLYGNIELQTQGYHKLHICTSTIQDYYRNELLNIYNCEYNEVITNNRLNAAAMIQYIGGIKANLWKYRDKLWEDIRSGSERLNQYNQLVNQLNELRNTFSADFVLLRNLDFRTALKP